MNTDLKLVVIDVKPYGEQLARIVQRWGHEPSAFYERAIDKARYGDLEGHFFDYCAAAIYDLASWDQPKNKNEEDAHQLLSSIHGWLRAFAHQANIMRLYDANRFISYRFHSVRTASCNTLVLQHSRIQLALL